MKFNLKNTKDMSESKVYDIMEKFIAEMEIPTTVKEKYCQFKRKDGDKYCTATSCKNCNECKLFTPTIHGKIRMITERYYELRKTIANMNREKRKLKRKIEDLERDKADRDISISVLEKQVEVLTDELEQYERGEK